jgi:hypothetical protein
MQIIPRPEQATLDATTDGILVIGYCYAWRKQALEWLRGVRRAAGRRP